VKLLEYVFATANLRALCCALVAFGALAACRTPGTATRVASSSDLEPAKGGAPGGTTWAARFGVQLKEENGALVVDSVEPVSAGCVMGLSKDDTVLAVNGVDVDSKLAFERAASKNYEQRFSPWCFTVKQANGAAAKVPMGCDFAALRQNPEARRYLCDAADMNLCGPLTERCMDPSARP
jgi:hypothetical protein